MGCLLQGVREEAWYGLIPAEFSMDSSEVTSLQRPLPLFVSAFLFILDSNSIVSLRIIRIIPVLVHRGCNPCGESAALCVSLQCATPGVAQERNWYACALLP